MLSVKSVAGSLLTLVFLFPVPGSRAQAVDATLRINEEGYFEEPGINVMLFDDFYPEGHQGGLTIIQNGTRVAANGDVRFDPTPGQWSPVPMMLGNKQVDREHATIRVNLMYPDTAREERGFNPIAYPDLTLRYSVTATAAGGGLRVRVDLESPLPAAWRDRVGFNLEFFPGPLFGKHYFMDGRSGIFPRQANGPMQDDAQGNLQMTPLAVGRELIIAPGHPEQEMKITGNTADLQLIDGRGLYNNGWFIVRSTIPAGASARAVEWTITPVVTKGWTSRPVVQVSQVGYHPAQKKFAVIELDKSTVSFEPIRLVRIGETGETEVSKDGSPKPWGTFLRYKYLRFDFSGVTQEGLYKVRYGTSESAEFEIRKDIYARHVWQPTLEEFLPEQMCHMLVRDRYKVWHGLCHMDDARMAPLNHIHFDGYSQGNSTLTSFRPGDHVPGLNVGGWHDAGDYDLRVESQSETVYELALAYELFGVAYDQTSINEETRVAELHKPDGKPDILEQVEHGALAIVGSYESMGRLYRGMISPTLRQYVHLGDASTMSDNLVYEDGKVDPILHRPLPNDDRWVFTEQNPRRELGVAQSLAAASRVLKDFRPALAERCLRVAEALWHANSAARPAERLNAAAELYLTTSGREEETFLRENENLIAKNVVRCSEVLGRLVKKLDDAAFTARVQDSVRVLWLRIAEFQEQNPYGVPYRPYIWGAGWEIQSFGASQLLLHLGFPKVFPVDGAFNALNFVLGCHPGENTSSFVSGVGARSLTVAYGANRDDWSYIPGGIASGTALIRPDLPELKVWPYFWQQTEYVMGGGTTDFLLLAIAADRLLNR